MNREPETAPSVDSSSSWRREIAIAAGCLAFGLIALPPAIYVVGQRMLGEYEGDGAMGLSESIWTDLLALQAPAWLLVLCPYLALQLIRGIRRLLRRPA